VAGAQAAVRNTDRATARSVVQRLVLAPPYQLFHADLFDDYGVKLATHRREQARSRLDWLVDGTFGPSRTYEYQLLGDAAARANPKLLREDELKSAALPSGTGRLVVMVDHHVVMNKFVTRWLVQSASEIFRMILLVGVLALVFHRLITRPLGRMAWHFSSINLDQPGDCRFPIPATHKEDELGLLANAVNNAMERLAGNVESQKQSYFHLSKEIQERRRAEHALQKKDEMLQQAQRLEAAGHLAAGVAQDFNHHLTSIQGYARILRDQAASGSQQASDAAQILLACEKAQGLTDELLSMSRRQTLDIVPVSLNTVLRQMQPTLLKSSPGVHIQLEPAPGLWNLRADRGLLEKAVTCLVSSSAEAMDGQGIIRLRTANCEFPESADGPPAGKWVRLSVEDEGPAIPQEALSRVFEPFSAVRGPNKKKEGLRLATAHGIARQCGGHLTVSSKIGEGTSFDLFLPMTPEAPRSVQSGSAPASAGRNETLLVVEPDDSLRSLLVRMLGTLGYRVIAAEDENKALDAARGANPPVDLMLSELDLPGASGPELHLRLREKGIGCRAIFTTGSGGQSSSRAAFGLKHADLLIKPYTQETLAFRIRETLDRESRSPE
jgi:signal transduction histidine kinase/CheY-like chemotaxis protein